VIKTSELTSLSFEIKIYNRKGGNPVIRIIMNGYNGKMGRVICELIKNDKEFEIVAGIDVTSSNAVFPTFISINDCNMPADVIIDFSTASAVPHVLKYALEKKLPTVICTTGIDDKTLKMIDDASKIIPVFKSANMSIGINIIANLLKKAAPILDEAGFDIEIVEKHHNQKIDAPSGTAILLADAVNSSMDNKFEYIYDRSNKREKRSKSEIGIQSIRAGTIVGEHSVIFAGKDEVIEFKHSAASKEIFAVGAIKAAKYVIGKPAGKYDMQDMINNINL